MSSDDSKYVWCRVKQGKGYFYVYVSLEFAMALCIRQGYEIKVPPPPNNREGQHDDIE